MDEILGIRLEIKRKKRMEKNRQREEQRKQQRQPFTAGDKNTIDQQKSEEKSSSKVNFDSATKHNGGQALDSDKKLSAKDCRSKRPNLSPPKSVVGSPSGASFASSMTHSPSPVKYQKKKSIRPWDWVDLDDDQDSDQETRGNLRKKRSNKRSGLPPRPIVKTILFKEYVSGDDDRKLVRGSKKLTKHTRKAKSSAQESSSSNDSPLKKRVVRKTLDVDSCDSDDSDDLVRDAKRLLKQKYKAKPIVEQSGCSSDCAAKERVLLTPPDFEDASDDDDFLRDAMLLAKKQKDKAELKKVESRPSRKSDCSDNGETKNAKRSPRQCASDESSIEPSLQSNRYTSVDSSHDQQLQSSPDKPTKSFKQQSSLAESPAKSIQVQRLYASIYGDGDEEAELKCLRPTNLDSLWSDSESERVDDEDGGVEKKRKRKKQESSGASTKKVARCARGTNSGGRASKGRNMKGSLSDNENSCDDDIDADELKPHFAIPKLGPPSALLPLVLKHSNGERTVPAAINRYLKGFQREGVVFMHSRVAENQGVILGDDMGLGKTVQVISMLAALLKKTGTGEDRIRLRQKQDIIRTKLDDDRKEQDRALRNGTIAQLSSRIEGLTMPKWAPILIIVPPSVVENWMNEFQTWGYFGAVAFSGASRDRALDRIRNGLDEIMVCGRSVFNQPDDIRDLKQIKWKLIVVDEYHQYKNHKTISYRGLQSLKETCCAPLVGLTGTMMQNNHEELWSEVDLVNPGFLGSLDEFKGDVSVPIKIGRTKTADNAAIEESNEIREWLQTKLKTFYIHRRKTDVLKDELPEKDERVLFCELSPMQKRLYKHFMTLPDFVLLKYANSPCECGVNQAIFQGFRRMRTEAEKLAYQRTNKSQITARKKCCHQRPLNSSRFEAGQEMYDPRAPLWRWQHESIINGEGDDDECKRCPFCTSFAALDKLYKLSSHVSLLQLQKHPDEFVQGSKGWKDAQKSLDFAKVAFPEDVLKTLPGGCLRTDGIMNKHAELSGKMKVLAELLGEFNTRGDRLLIFSFSTQMLDLIQSFVKSMGYSFLRLDGSTPTRARQGLVDKFQQDDSIFLFLISTKAGGLGLNLTAANVVIVFDVDFNPSNDEQSQDRAYRIGQKQDVLVIRLVSRGTVEELKYIRQIYKVQLTNDTIGQLQGGPASEAARLFSAVHGDKDRKGELFGMENLLKFKDGSFMEDLWKSSATNDSIKLKGLNRFKLRSNDDVAAGIDGMTPEQVIELGGNIADEEFRKLAFERTSGAEQSNCNSTSVSDLLGGDNARSHGDYLRADRGDALYQPGDAGFDEEMGGESQAAHYVFENAAVPRETNEYTKPTMAADPARHHQTNLEAYGDVVPSPVRSGAVARLPARAAKVEMRPEKAASLSPARISLAYPARHGKNDTSKSSTSREQQTPKMNVSRAVQSKTIRPETTHRPASGDIKKGITTFTTKDLFLPGYAKKKKKKKKKSM